MKKIVVVLAVPVLYLLHQDIWFWNNPNRVLGLPVGLTYHIIYCLLASVLMMSLVRWAWPAHLEIEAQDMKPTKVNAWH